MQVRRPRVEVINQVDIAWRLENHSIFIYETRPLWNEPADYEEYPFAKATFLRSQSIWKISTRHPVYKFVTKFARALPLA